MNRPSVVQHEPHSWPPGHYDTRPQHSLDPQVIGVDERAAGRRGAPDYVVSRVHADRRASDPASAPTRAFPARAHPRCHHVLDQHGRRPAGEIQHAKPARFRSGG